MEKSGRRQKSEGWRLGAVLGVPVILARSWFVIAVVITVAFADPVRAADPSIGRAPAFGVAFGYAVLLCLSVLVHELAHALVARRAGVPPTRIVLTLWGGHTQFDTDTRSPGASFAIAVAGPLSNGVLALLAWGLLGVLDLPPVLRLLVVALALTNAFVAVTNLLPGLPLDGGRLLEAVVWRVRGDRDLATVVAAWTGRVVAVGVPAAVAVAWFLQGVRPSLITVAWTCLVGALLWSGAGAELQGARIRRRAPSASVAALARPAVVVPATADLAAALAAPSAARTERGSPGVGEVVLVDGAGRPVAVLDPAAAHAVPAERRALVPASSAARVLAPGAVLAWEMPGVELLRALSSLPGSRWVAVDATGAVRGVLLSEDVVAAVVGPHHGSRGGGRGRAGGGRRAAVPTAG